MKDAIADAVSSVILKLKLPEAAFAVEHPELLSHGDYATNVAMVLGKKTGKNPKELAEEIVKGLKEEKLDGVESFSVAGPGFINIHLSSRFFNSANSEIVKKGKEYGNSQIHKGEKTMVEYTDPNPFKEFHVGHMMNNAIGESLSRIIASQGAEVKRACYSGDKGVHVAKAVAHKLRTDADWKTVQDIAISYVEGAKLYDTDENFELFVTEINKKIYDESDEKVNKVYMFGRRLTLDYFETIYKTLGTKFDFYFFESTTGEFGKALVRRNVPKVFEESEGAIIYRGEKRDPTLHTRVFINKDGIPTYEAKELGLAKIKYDTYPYDNSIVITGNEVNDYFRVLMSALGEIFPDLAKKTHHIGHGMMRLPSGKISSRKGDAPTAESLIDAMKGKVKEKMSASERESTPDDVSVSSIAIGAIKYMILRQAPGRDIIFDFETALSFEGDSGPYLQYTNARIHSLLEKGGVAGIAPKLLDTESPSDLEKILYRFPEVVSRAYTEKAPHLIVTFLTEVAGLFNAFYGNNLIVDQTNKTLSAHRLFIAKAVSQVLQNGLGLLAISPLEKM
jgi:arginyl-tRNA synthetase